MSVENFSVKRALFNRYDVFHIHWPERILHAPTFPAALLRFAVLMLLIAVLKRRGTKLVWTVHNLQGHDVKFPLLESLLWRWFIPRLNGYICLTKGGQRLILQRHPSLQNRPGFVIPHGDYRHVYPDTVSTSEAKSELGIGNSERLIVYFGQIRSYKDIPTLMKAFSCITASAVKLAIAGKPASRALATELRRAAEKDPRIFLRLEFIPDDQVQVFMKAADIIVLPYREVLNSGSAILALSFGRPILVPDQGAMAELQRLVGNEWIRTYEGALESQTLQHALAWAVTMPRDFPRMISAFSWEDIAMSTVNAYYILLDQYSSNKYL